MGMIPGEVADGMSGAYVVRQQRHGTRQAQRAQERRARQHAASQAGHHELEHCFSYSEKSYLETNTILISAGTKLFTDARNRVGWVTKE